MELGALATVGIGARTSYGTFAVSQAYKTILDMPTISYPGGKARLAKQIIAAFLDSGQVDEFIIHVIPKMIGEGIPLLAPRHRDLRF
jgi:hypothetical protein